MWAIVIEALMPLDRTLHMEMYKNNAGPRLFCRIAKKSIIEEHLRMIIAIDQN